MFELDAIFAEQLTTTVFLYGSAIMLAIAATGTWLISNPSRSLGFNAAQPALNAQS